MRQEPLLVDILRGKIAILPSHPLGFLMLGAACEKFHKFPLARVNARLFDRSRKVSRFRNRLAPPCFPVSLPYFPARLSP